MIFLGESDDDDSDSSSSSSSSDSDSDSDDDGTDAMIDAAKKTADGVGETVIIDHTEAGFQKTMFKSTVLSSKNTRNHNFL